MSLSGKDSKTVTWDLATEMKMTKKKKKKKKKKQMQKRLEPVKKYLAWSDNCREKEPYIYF